MTEEEMVALVEELYGALAAKFPKIYSALRLSQVRSHLDSLLMFIHQMHMDVVSEEDQARKDSVIQRMVLGGRNLTEATADVERGVR